MRDVHSLACSSVADLCKTYIITKTIFFFFVHFEEKNLNNTLVTPFLPINYVDQQIIFIKLQTYLEYFAIQLVLS